MDIFNKRAVSNIDHGLSLGRREIVRAEIYQERIAAPVEWGPITLHMATISECRYRWLRVPDLNLSIGLHCTADAFDRRSHRGAQSASTAI
jgi:hypothetical protein